jgi:hypothetical protein
MHPEYAKYRRRDGTVVVKLLKAMYGCVQSSLLLYNHVRQTLLDLGFSTNPYDECVFNRGVGEQQCTICLYVDDILMTCRDGSVIDEMVADREGAPRRCTLVHRYDDGFLPQR